MQHINRDSRRVASARDVGRACGLSKLSPWQAQDFAMSTALGRVLLDGASEDRAVEGTTNHAYWTAYHEAREEVYRGA
jgi:hypothetical protein